MAAPIPFLLPFQLSDIGAPLVAGQLYTYALGTSDPKVTYVDSEGTILNTNPIILNSAGRFRCYLGVGGYNFVLRDAQGGLIWQESYNNVGGGSGGGSIQVTSTIADLRAVGGGSTQFAMVMGYYEAGDIGQRTYRFDASSSLPDDGGGVIAPNAGDGRWILEWDGTPISVRVFGAKGDGVFDDSAPVIAAQAWAAGMNLKSGIQFTHVPVFYNLGNDALEISIFATSLPGSLIRPPINGMVFTGGFYAGPYRVFYENSSSLAGAFQNAKLLTPACPEWFGAVGNDVTDDLDAIAALFLTAPNFMAFPSGVGYSCSSAPFEATPNPVIILAAGRVFNHNIDEAYIEAGITISGVFIGASAEIVTAVIETLSVTTLGVATADIGTLNVTAMLYAFAANVANNLTVGGTATIAGLLTSGPAKVRGGGSAALGSVPSIRYTNPVAVNNVGATQQALRSFLVVDNIMNAVGAEIEFEAFGRFAANVNTKNVKLTMIDNVPIESLLVSVGLTSSGGFAYSWEMKGKIVIRSATQYVVYGKGKAYRVSTNEAVIVVSSTGALADTGLSPIPNPTVVADATVTVTPTVTNIIKAAIGIATPGITLNQALTVRLLAQGAASDDITVDYFKVQLHPAP